MKVIMRIIDSLIRQVVTIDESQFGFVPGRGTTDAIFVIRQLQEKHLTVGKRIYMAFVDLQKAFDRVRGGARVASAVPVLAETMSSAMGARNGSTRNAVGSSEWRGTYGETLDALGVKERPDP